MSIEKLKLAAEQIVSRMAAVKSEEATKQAMVMPMIQAMGYDIWNPEEVCPEYEADFDTKKKAGPKEKVDLAIFRGNNPAIYVEVKSVDTKLCAHEGQLKRYFNATPEVSLAILTNGVEWRLYTDTAADNRLDDEPFYVCRLDAVEQGLDVLANFCKAATFTRDTVRDNAKELKYTDTIAIFLREHLNPREGNTDESFIRWILGELKEKGGPSGVVTANVVNSFRPIVNKALTRIFQEIVRRSMSAAMDAAAAPTITQSQSPPVEEVTGTPKDENPSKSIITTEDELALYKAIEEIFDHSPYKGGVIYEPFMRREIPIELGYKDTTAYFGIYFNKPGWWFMRAMLDGKNKWLGFDLPAEIGIPLVPEAVKILPKNHFSPMRVAFSGLDDLRLLEPVILATMEHNVRQLTNNQDGDGETAS